MTCEKCETGTFSFVPMTEPGNCIPCPEFGICENDTLYPKKGYARFDVKSDVFVRCFYKEACLRGNMQNELKNCAEGYAGVLCASCADNYWKPHGTSYCY